MSSIHQPHRRGFLLGLLAAPAIVRASSLMAINPLPLEYWGDLLKMKTASETVIYLEPINQFRVLGWKRMMMDYGRAAA